MKHQASIDSQTDNVPSVVLAARSSLVATPHSVQSRPLRTSSLKPPTHYEPPWFVPGRHLPDPESQQVDRDVAGPAGRRPILAWLCRAEGRLYGRPDPFDLRSLAYLELGLFGDSAGHFGPFADREGMQRQSSDEPTFFTERSLAAYLAVSDRTIRNWIRRGELTSYKLGASRRIDPTDVDAFLAARREERP